jgi:hypothetical protein
MGRRASRFGFELKRLENRLEAASSFFCVSLASGDVVAAGGGGEHSLRLSGEHASLSPLSAAD